MVGQIIYLTVLFFIVAALIWSYRAGAIIVSNIGKSIPIDYEVMGEHGVPLITLTSLHGKKYTFLVDTGANSNYFSKALIEDFTEEQRKPLTTTSFYGVDGIDRAASTSELTFTHRNSKLTDIYMIADMAGVFERYQETIGKEIHGILGTTFLKKHGMNLDINRMIVWERL